MIRPRNKQDLIHKYDSIKGAHAEILTYMSLFAEERGDPSADLLRRRGGLRAVDAAGQHLRLQEPGQSLAGHALHLQGSIFESFDERQIASGLYFSVVQLQATALKD